jgi:hypothetical protein
MATRLYSLNPGDDEFDVTEAVGSATATKSIELTVDLATSIVSDNGTTRTIRKQEVLDALEKFQNYILRKNWPPA